MNSDLGKIILYQSEDGHTSMDVHLKDETVWLTLNQMAELLDRDKSVISRHLGNVFQTGELAREAVVAKNATTASDGKTYQVDYYNLDAIISVGYRVNSKRGTQFRIWATTILKDHLLRGYSLNQRRLAEKGVEEVRQVLSLLAGTLESHNLVSDGGKDLYPSVEEKAAHLLYFVIKDHPFTDGNKRIGSFLFLLFLKKNDLLDQKSFSNKALVALALLTAASEPGQKELMVRLIVNLISEEG
jgi:prophage maintenance system killer protein